MVICIGREFGSGGHDVGYKLAELLGIPYYDKKILDDMEGLGMNRELIERADENVARGLFRTPYFGIREERLKAAEKLALFLGAEGDGLRQETIDGCDHAVIIPMYNSVNSLNVAAAGAVACWELFGR
jgi:tRNA C32,U32 (ribose-2'-O)-methylase TrmJ